MGNKSRWQAKRPYPGAARKAGQAGRYVTDIPSDYQPYMTVLSVPDLQSQSFYDRLKHYIGDTDPQFRKLMRGDTESLVTLSRVMRGDTESLATLSRGFLEKCGREIWASEPSQWEHDRMYGRNWVAEHWLKDQEVLVDGLVALFRHMRGLLWVFADPTTPNENADGTQNKAKKKRGGKNQKTTGSHGKSKDVVPLHQQHDHGESTALTRGRPAGRTIDEMFDDRARKTANNAAEVVDLRSELQQTKDDDGLYAMVSCYQSKRYRV